MEKRKIPLSFNVIYWIMNLITGLFLVICVGVLAFYVLLWTDFFGDERQLQLHINLPGQVEFCNTGFMEYQDGVVEVELVEASTKIHFIDTPTSLARTFTLILMGVCAITFFLLLTFQQFVANVRVGKVFTISNILRLKNISYALVGFWVLMIIYRRIAYYYISARVDIENVEIISEFNNYIGIILAALFIWVLSHIFIRGLRLQEEQELTI